MGVILAPCVVTDNVLLLEWDTAHSPNSNDVPCCCCRSPLPLTAGTRLSGTLASPVTFLLWGGAHAWCLLPRQTPKAT